MPQIVGIDDSSVSGGYEFPRKQGDPVVKIAREVWLVLAESYSVTMDQILSATGLPQRGDTRGVMSAKQVEARPQKPGSLMWEVEVQWDSRLDQQQDQNSDPTQWRPQVKWTTEMLEVALPSDPVTGRQIANSLGEPFFITGPLPVCVRTLTRYENRDIVNGIDDLQLQFAGRTNSEPFHGWPADTVLLFGIDAEDAVVGGLRLAQMTYVTKYLNFKVADTVVVPRDDPDMPGGGTLTTLTQIGWRASLLNESGRYRENANDPAEDWKEFKTHEGSPTRGNLKIDGTKAADGEQIYLRFFRHLRANLNQLVI